MTKDLFHTPDQAAEQLAQEIRELKEVLREISQKVSRIEKQAKLTFPKAFEQVSSQDDAQESLVLSSEKAVEIYDDLVIQAKQDNDDVIKQKLLLLPLSHLKVISQEIGISLNKKKQTKENLIKEVIGRVRQSVIISQDFLDSETTKKVQNEVTENRTLELPLTKAQEEP